MQIKNRSSFLAVLASSIILLLVWTSQMQEDGSLAIDGHELELYKPDSVVVSKKLGGGIFLEGVGGVAFRIKNDTDNPKLLVLEGENLHGKASLRMRTSGSPPKWVPAPDGLILKIQIDPRLSTEFLIYQDELFHYKLSAVRVEDCHQCLSEENFKSKLIDEVSKLKQKAYADDIEQVALWLLDYVANTVDLGSTKRSQFAHLYAPAQLTNLFATNSAEGSCGLFAQYFSSVLNILGFNALTVDFGIDSKNSLTHVTTVIRFPNGKFYVFDPTFNGVYRLSDGSLADLDQVLSDGIETFFQTKSIRRDVWFNQNQFQSFVNNQTIIKKGFPVRTCREMVLIDGRFWFCPDVPYDWVYVFDGWKDRLALHDIDETHDVFKTFLKNGEVYSVSGYNQAHIFELIERFNRLGVRVRSQ